jgi:peroxin-7
MVITLIRVPINVLQGHRYPVRKVKFSPHDPSILASASYDMMVIIWDTNPNSSQVVKIHSAHTEFAVGIDFSLHVPKLLASVGWDGRCLVWPWDTT